MNEQAKHKQVKSDSNAFNLEDGVQDMVARIMTIARLLLMDDAVCRKSTRGTKLRQHRNDTVMEDNTRIR
jgi:hypothetical protein